MSISQWPEHQRPREKLIHKGPHSLSDAELLAIFLRNGLPGQSAVSLSQDLINRCGSLRDFLKEPVESLCDMPGLGLAKVAQVMAALELGRRNLQQGLQQGPGLASPTETAEFLLAQLQDRPYETFCCLYLDTRHRVLAFEELFRGGLKGATVYPGEVVKRALHHHAAAVILAHNHPSGVCEPSEADKHLTERLQQALELVDIKVLDHLVLGDRAWVSLADRGLI